MRIHVIGANNEQNGMFSVEKHEWPIEPFMRGADQISVVEFSGSEVLDAFLPSAGGPYRLPGDYVYSNQRLPYSQSGQWGYLRVLPAGDQRLLPLAGAGAGMKSASVRQCGAGDSGRSEVSIECPPRRRAMQEKGEAARLPPFALCASIWYDDEIALSYTDRSWRNHEEAAAVVVRLADDDWRNRLGL